jgi:hypothetical protein
LLTSLNSGRTGVLDQHGAVLRVAVLHRVGLPLAQLGGGVEHALDGLDVGQPAAVGGGPRIHFSPEIDRVGEQALLVGLQVGDAGVAGVGAALEDGDRPLQQAQPRGILQPQAQERELRLGVLVVDGDARPLHVLADDGQRTRLFP